MAKNILILMCKMNMIIMKREIFWEAQSDSTFSLVGDVKYTMNAWQ